MIFRKIFQAKTYKTDSVGICDFSENYSSSVARKMEKLSTELNFSATVKKQFVIFLIISNKFFRHFPTPTNIFQKTVLKKVPLNRVE